MIKNLREILVEKYNYKDSPQTDNVVEKISKFSAKITAAFEKWFNTGEIDSTEVEGYTVKSIMEKQPMKEVSAYITLSWLEQDPVEAKKALNRPIIGSRVR